MMKIPAVSVLGLFVVLVHDNLALNVQNYTTFVEQLAEDSRFLGEYVQWSVELLSQRDYRYGRAYGPFRCPKIARKDNEGPPRSVHSLRPSDVKCLAAMGDSFITGLGAHAITPIDLLIENRGLSWTIGGDYTYAKLLSLPNIFREYNADVRGFSTKVTMMASGEHNSTKDGLNLGEAGACAADMPHQAERLLRRIKDERVCDWNNDWKVVTLSVGSNDLCSFCQDADSNQHTPEHYIANIRLALDTLYQAPMPRTFVNLILAPDVRNVKERSNAGYVCEVLQRQLCPCAASPSAEQVNMLDNYLARYQRALVDLVTTGRYDGRDDFTVVIQPFMINSTLLFKENRTLDLGYFAPDCFHFSGKGHAQAALSLWNNMLEPVGGKRWSWHIGEPFKCPTEEYPYLFTSKNSAAALNALTPQQTYPNTGSTSRSDTTTPSPLKNDQPGSKTSSKATKVLLVLFFLISIAAAGVWVVNKRRKTRTFDPQTSASVSMGVHNRQLADENDDADAEIWNRSSIPPIYFNDNSTIKTHGRRVSFDAS